MYVSVEGVVLTKRDHGQVASSKVTLETLADLGGVSTQVSIVVQRGNGLLVVIGACLGLDGV